MKVEKHEQIDVTVVMKSDKMFHRPGLTNSEPEFRAYYGTRYINGAAGLEQAQGERVSGLFLDAAGWRALSEFAREVAEHLESLK